MVIKNREVSADQVAAMQEHFGGVVAKIGDTDKTITDVIADKEGVKLMTVIRKKMSAG